MRIAAFVTLEAIVRNGSFAAAAQEVNVTPSAVSMQMKQLEQYLGKQLFDRSGLQVRPTATAHELVELMRLPLHHLDAMRSTGSVVVEGRLKVGIIESMQAQVLPGTLRILVDRYPRLQLKPSRGRSSSLTSAVKAGDLDAALVAQPPRVGPGLLQWEPMLRRELVLIAPPSATESSLAALFRRYEWVRYERDTVTGSLATRFVHEHVAEHRSSLELDTAMAIVATVSAGLGIAIVQPPDAAQLSSYPLRIVRLGRAAPVLQLSLVTRKADSESRALHAFRDALRSALLANDRRLQRD
ncbi:LysR family transcriptional regulator [Pollutimonas subterranea]|uniref:LysR family transcriptional regulator n=1 Tax=Pollutimonas subterranea TaxID=2045210 RepID=A0A2N4U498_9BURK|nr:LysR family transcriptional regulator [Pollutimonas subterranea]PLC49844.1 LysR family transcriptional regulator [Pollutimonas subterranea]